MFSVFFIIYGIIYNRNANIQYLIEKNLWCLCGDHMSIKIPLALVKISLFEIVLRVNEIVYIKFHLEQSPWVIWRWVLISEELNVETLFLLNNKRNLKIIKTCLVSWTIDILEAMSQGLAIPASEPQLCLNHLCNYNQVTYEQTIYFLPILMALVNMPVLQCLEYRWDFYQHKSKNHRMPCKASLLSPIAVGYAHC